VSARKAGRREPKWISKPVVLALHQALLAEHGGATGLSDEGLLEAALASPRNHFAHDEQADLPVLAAACALSIVRNHPFADGNKRVALTVAGVFLERNGLRLDAAEHDAAQATRALAAGELGLREFAEWLRTSTSRARRPLR
jgi:death-on-curing protein